MEVADVTVCGRKAGLVVSLCLTIRLADFIASPTLGQEKIGNPSMTREALITLRTQRVEKLSPILAAPFFNPCPLLCSFNVPGGLLIAANSAEHAPWCMASHSVDTADRSAHVNGENGIRLSSNAMTRSYLGM